MTAPICHSCTHCSNAENTAQAAAPGTAKESNHCHLVHCSFCDYGLCCLVGSYPACEENAQSSEICLHTTDNPAYGLPSKEWLECKEMESSNGKMNPSRRKDGRNETSTAPKKPSPTSYASVAPSYLESIPESREVGAPVVSAAGCDTRQTELYSYSDSETDSPEQTHRTFDDEPDVALSSFWDGCDGESKAICDRQCNSHLEGLNKLSSDSEDVKVINTKPKFSERDKFLAGLLPESQPRFPEAQQPTHHHHHIHGTRPPYPFQQRARYEVNKPRRYPHLARDKCYTLGPERKKADADEKRKSNGLAKDALAEITSVKTEESVQEWLSRISEWVESNSWIKDNCDDDDDDLLGTKYLLEDKRDKQLSKIDSQHAHRLEELQKEVETIDATGNDHSVDDHSPRDSRSDNELKDIAASAKHALQHATKERPAKVPMVVMQCSRLHSHITSKPPFQQSSLPMGTLVTALYQESDWLYVQTPHGVEGFVSSANCIPIGTVRTSEQSKRPWEPCDFPIEISIKNTTDFGRQHTMFLPTRLPVSGCTKQLAPFVNVVKMKTSFYGDKFFNNTFKLRDSIKTAKTVTDILKSSPEIEINNT